MPSAKRSKKKEASSRPALGVASAFPAVARNWKASCPVMGLDLSLTAAGVAIYSPGGTVLALETLGYGVRSKTKDPPKVAILARLQRSLEIAERLIALAEEHEVGRVGVEGYAFGSFGGSATVTGLAELGGLVKSQLWLACKLIVEPVTGTSAKKEILGDGWGHGTKEDVMEYWRLEGVEFANDNESDALLIGRFVWMRDAQEHGVRR